MLKPDYPFFDLTIRGHTVKAAIIILTDNSVPGTSGLPSIARLVDRGYAIYSF
jgi:hypothetical protein